MRSQKHHVSPGNTLPKHILKKLPNEQPLRPSQPRQRAVAARRRGPGRSPPPARPLPGGSSARARSARSPAPLLGLALPRGRDAALHLDRHPVHQSARRRARGRGLRARRRHRPLRQRDRHSRLREDRRRRLRRHRSRLARDAPFPRRPAQAPAPSRVRRAPRRSGSACSTGMRARLSISRAATPPSCWSSPTPPRPASTRPRSSPPSSRPTAPSAPRGARLAAADELASLEARIGELRARLAEAARAAGALAPDAAGMAALAGYRGQTEAFAAAADQLLMRQQEVRRLAEAPDDAVRLVSPPRVPGLRQLAQRRPCAASLDARRRHGRGRDRPAPRGVRARLPQRRPGPPRARRPLPRPPAGAGRRPPRTPASARGSRRCGP